MNGVNNFTLEWCERNLNRRSFMYTCTEAKMTGRFPDCVCRAAGRAMSQDERTKDPETHICVCVCVTQYLTYLLARNG